MYLKMTACLREPVKNYLADFVRSFQALEVPKPRVRKRPFSLTKMAFSSLSDWAFAVPETKI